MGVKKRGPPPKPPAVAEKPKEEAEFEIICVLCTNVAVNQEDKKPMSKGTEVPLLAYSSTSILDVKRMLQSRTGLPRDHIEVKMQGDDVLPDSTRVKPNNPVPYFIFNTHEPSDRELQEIRKIEKIKNRPKLEDIDWSQFSGPVAIALYDYDALGEEGTLNFDEGDIVEIVEKSPDGWWRGRMQDTEGDFPASFVEEVEIPTTMEEKKQLALRFRKNSPDQLQEADAFTFQDEGRASPGLRKLRKLQSNPEPTSPTSKAKVDRRTSEPVFSQLEGARKDKKRHGLFKKRGGTQYGALQEEPVDISNKKSPFMSDRRKKKVVSLTSSWEDATASIESPEMQKKQPLVKPMASPKATKRKIGGAVAEGAPKTVRPRRPPPPVPTARATHVAVDTEEMIRLANDDVPLEQEGGAEAENDSKGRSSNPCSPPTPAEENSVSPELVVSEEDRNTPLTDTLSPDSVKKSESMEELLKNLEEFDEVISSQNGPTSLEIEEQERDFATIPRSELPVAKKSLGVPSVMDEDQKSKSTSNTPEAVRKSKPSVPSRQKLVQNGFSHSQPDEPTQPKPMAPPRRKKKMSQQLLDRVGVFEDGSSSKPTPGLKPVRPAPRVPASCPPPKPERDETKRKKTRLEVMAERQASSSAPTSRNASPDVERLLTKESSTSQEGLDSRSPGLAKRSPPSSSSPPPSLSYAAAHKCIGFLSDEERVATEHVFRSRPGSSEAVDMWLRGLDRGEAPDLSDIRDTADVTALLKALLSSKRLGPLIDYPLAKAMCDLVKGASPVSVLGNQLEQLTAENRGLLKELLRLFGLVINYSDKNKIEVSDLNRMFGSVLFDRLPPAKTEQLLAYLISTCELLIAS